MAYQKPLTPELAAARVAFVKEHNTTLCPDCARQSPRPHVRTVTAYCPNCDRIWKLSTTGKDARRHWWYDGVQASKKLIGEVKSRPGPRRSAQPWPLGRDTTGRETG